MFEVYAQNIFYLNFVAAFTQRGFLKNIEHMKKTDSNFLTEQHESLTFSGARSPVVSLLGH